VNRAILTGLLWSLSGLLYYVLAHVMDRESITGTLLAGHPTFQHVAALLALMSLRVATILVFPAVLFALVIEALLARILRGRKPNADQSIIEASQIGSSDQNG
jgi:hypothetical protein